MRSTAARVRCAIGFVLSVAARARDVVEVQAGDRFSGERLRLGHGRLFRERWTGAIEFSADDTDAEHARGDMLAGTLQQRSRHHEAIGAYDSADARPRNDFAFSAALGWTF